MRPGLRPPTLPALRLRHVLPATYLLIALMAGGFSVLGWCVGEEARRAVDELVREDMMAQQTAAELADAVGAVSTSLVAAMTHVRPPAAGYAEAARALDVVEARTKALRLQLATHADAAPVELVNELETAVASALLVRPEILDALEHHGADLHPPLKRWTVNAQAVEASLRELRLVFAGHTRAGQARAEHWLNLGLWLAAAAMVACAVVGVGGTVFVVQHVARPLDWGTRILHKLAAGRRDLVIPRLERRDEIGDLFAAFADYQQSLREGEVLAREVALQRARLDTALNNMSHGLAMFDGSSGLILCNGRYAALYSLPDALTQPGTTLTEILDHRERVSCGPADRDTFTREHVTRAVAGEASHYRLPLQDGRIIKVAHQPMPDGGWIATHEDITDATQAEARIAHMARHDALTDLPNRVRFREALVEALRRVERDESVAVHCLDLDRFKGVNDALGHPIGDALLTQVAQRLRACVRDTDTVARLGGDEFAIVQVGAAQPIGATALAHRAIEALSAPYTVDGHEIVVGASVGIAVAPHDGSDPDQLLKNADLALYRAKADGRGGSHFFEAGMDAAMQTRRALEVDLRLALARGEFALHYQPLVNVRSGQVSGFEALLRWHHPARGLVSPAEFIPLAEDVGVIVPIGEWVLRQACQDAAAWPGDTRVAVNLSPVQFRSRHLVAAVFSALASSGLPATRLELEITEAVMLDDTDTTLATLHQLRALGVRISMDDFGTGYSSLSYLRKFPFDKIKIDQSFIRDLPTRSDSLAIVRAVASLGQSLGITTTAEGVETAEQLASLQAEGCEEVQGYLYSRPIPASELGLWLAGRSEARVA